MLVQYVANGLKRDIREVVANALIARKIARAVEQEISVKNEEILETPKRRGRPKKENTYQTKDMIAEV